MSQSTVLAEWREEEPGWDEVKKERRVTRWRLTVQSTSRNFVDETHRKDDTVDGKAHEAKEDRGWCSRAKRRTQQKDWLKQRNLESTTTDVSETPGKGCRAPSGDTCHSNRTGEKGGSAAGRSAWLGVERPL